MAAARVLPVEDRPVVSPDVVRRWAIQQGLTVGVRGHLPKEVIARFNAKHRKSRAVNNNPWAGARKEQSDG
jgi:hypothetical protein